MNAYTARPLCAPILCIFLFYIRCKCSVSICALYVTSESKKSEVKGKRGRDAICRNFIFSAAFAFPLFAVALFPFQLHFFYFMVRNALPVRLRKNPCPSSPSATSFFVYSFPFRYASISIFAET